MVEASSAVEFGWEVQPSQSIVSQELGVEWAAAAEVEVSSADTPDDSRLELRSAIGPTASWRSDDCDPNDSCS